MKINLWANLAFQTLATVFQGLNAAGVVVPHDVIMPVAIGAGIAQGVVATISHYYNPDGTPVAMPYPAVSQAPQQPTNPEQ